LHAKNQNKHHKKKKPQTQQQQQKTPLQYLYYKWVISLVKFIAFCRLKAGITCAITSITKCTEIKAMGKTVTNFASKLCLKLIFIETDNI